MDGREPAGAPSGGTSGRRTHAQRARFARFLSLVCPGLGQLYMGRWVAGLCQLALLLGTVVAALGAGGWILFRIYSSALSDGLGSAGDIALELKLPLVVLLSGVGGVVLLNLWSVWDAGKKPTGDDGA